MNTAKTVNWRNFIISIGILGIFSLSSTPLLATQPQNKASQDDGVGIGKAEQPSNDYSHHVNEKRGTDPSGPRDRDPNEIETSSGRVKNDTTGNTSQHGGDGKTRVERTQEAK